MLLLCLFPRMSVLIDQKMVEMYAAAAYFGPQVYPPLRQPLSTTTMALLLLTFSRLQPPQIGHAASSGSVSIESMSLHCRVHPCLPNHVDIGLHKFRPWKEEGRVRTGSPSRK
jgi:hypothetical protein